MVQAASRRSMVQVACPFITLTPSRGQEICPIAHSLQCNSSRHTSTPFDHFFTPTYWYAAVLSSFHKERRLPQSTHPHSNQLFRWQIRTRKQKSFEFAAKIHRIQFRKLDDNLENQWLHHRWCSLANILGYLPCLNVNFLVVINKRLFVDIHWLINLWLRLIQT